MRRNAPFSSAELRHAELSSALNQAPQLCLCGLVLFIKRRNTTQHINRTQQLGIRLVFIPDTYRITDTDMFSMFFCIKNFLYNIISTTFLFWCQYWNLWYELISILIWLVSFKMSHWTLLCSNYLNTHIVLFQAWSVTRSDWFLLPMPIQHFLLISALYQYVIPDGPTSLPFIATKYYGMSYTRLKQIH